MTSRTDIALRQYISLVSPAKSWAPLTAQDRARILTCGIAGIDVRLGTPGEADAIGSAIASGLEATGTAWVGHRSPSGHAAVTEILGIQQGRFWADYCLERGLRAFRANAERDVWRGPVDEQTGKPTPAPGALDFLDGFASAFRSTAPGVTLRYAGFAVPSWHYAGAVLPPASMARWQGVDVMAYQSTRTALLNTLARARRQWGSAAMMGAYCGVGRIDESGDVIGNADAWVEVAHSSAARLTTLLHYVGNGAEGQLLQGHSRHVSVVEQVQRIARAAGRPEACA